MAMMLFYGERVFELSNFARTNGFSGVAVDGENGLR